MDMTHQNFDTTSWERISHPLGTYESFKEIRVQPKDKNKGKQVTVSEERNEENEDQQGEDEEQQDGNAEQMNDEEEQQGDKEKNYDSDGNRDEADD